MKLGIYFKDNHSPNVGYKNPEKGNPGTGGTQFCFLMLMRYLAMYYPETSIVCYHTGEQFFPDGVIDVRLKSESDLFVSNLDDVDILLFRCNGGDEKWYSAIENISPHCVAWAHNDITSKELRCLESSKKIKRVVCVGQQQYDRMVDTKIFDKTTYIYNMYECDRQEYDRAASKPIVTYVGSLVKGKGFHVLAKQWRNILKQVPDAELYVLGSSQTYNDSVCEFKTDYERECISTLSDENGNLLPSVHFCGNLGASKVDIYNMTKVGVVNPTAKTETFCLGAVEMQACGVPIVSKRKGGLLDTVSDGKSGLLYLTESSLCKCIVKLLKDDRLNAQFGDFAKCYVERFSPKLIVKEWMQMFSSICDSNDYDMTNRQMGVHNHYLSNFKFLRIANKTGYSFIYIEDIIRDIKANILRRILGRK